MRRVVWKRPRALTRVLVVLATAALGACGGSEMGAFADPSGKAANAADVEVFEHTFTAEGEEWVLNASSARPGESFFYEFMLTAGVLGATLDVSAPGAPSRWFGFFYDVDVTVPSCALDDALPITVKARSLAGGDYIDVRATVERWTAGPASTDDCKVNVKEARHW